MLSALPLVAPRPLVAALVWMLGLAPVVCLAPAGRAAGPELADPYLVFHPAGDCTTGQLELEVWDREERAWQPHPLHWRILADTCQREDAGGLLNELRVRCYDPARPGRELAWRVGFSLAQLREQAECGSPPQLAARIERPSPLITLEAPPAGQPIRNLTQRARFTGRVDLSHELLVLLDASFEPATRRALARALEGSLDELRPLIGALRVAWLRFAPGSAGDRADAPEPIAYAASPAPVRAGLTQWAAAGDTPGDLDLAASLARAGATPFGVAGHAARRSVVILADGRAPLPFGAAAGADPIHRARLLEQLQALLERGVALQLLVLGEQESRLAELLDRIGELLAAAPARSALRVVPALGGPGLDAAVDGAFGALELVRLERLAVMNASHGILADVVELEPAGRFRGEVGLESGENRLRFEARLSDGRTLEADFLREFDYSLIKERFLEAERERIRRARALRGIVTIEAEDRPGD